MKQVDAIILSCFGYELTSNEKNFFKNINPFKKNETKRINIFEKVFFI